MAPKTDVIAELRQQVEEQAELVEKLAEALKEVMSYGDQGYPTDHIAIEALDAYEQWKEKK